MAPLAARSWAAAAILLFIFAQGISIIGQKKILPPFEAPPLEEFAVMDVSAALAGMRRFGADLAFIQFLHFIAQPMEDVELKRSGMGPAATQEHRHDHVHDHTQNHDRHGSPENASADEFSMSETNLAKIADFSLRSVNLDPYFHYSYLFGSGLLAFYLNRYEDALKIIQRGIERDPAYWRFRLYAGAIGYKSQNQTDKVIPLLEEALSDPNCPTMIANILGNLYEMTGAYAKAAAVYRHILATSRDGYDLQKAAQKLEVLTERHGV